MGYEMTSLDLTKLREIAEAATPGPWEAGITTFGDPSDGPTHSCVREAGSGGFDRVAASEGCDEADLNMAHIAAFDPPTVIALIGELERLRETLATVKAITDGTPECDKYDDKSPVTCGWKFDLQRIKEVVK